MTHALQNSRCIKSKLLTLILVSFLTQTIAQDYGKSITCDLCGCVSSGGAAVFGTLNNTSFIGIKYTSQNYESRNGIFDNSPITNEGFQSFQLWSKIPINDRWFLTANVPYQILNRQTLGLTDEDLNGLGDVTAMGWYSFPLYEKLKGTDIPFENKIPNGHVINIGLGVKLPTGKFEQRLTDRINPGFQLGTGSIDPVITLMHTYAKNKIGVNSSIAYYYKTANKNEYKFGNQLSINSNVFYQFAFKSSSLSPFLGLSSDVFQPIEQYGEQLVDTEGYVVNANLGTEYKFSSYLLGATYTLPFLQELFAGNVESKARLSFYINYLF